MYKKTIACIGAGYVGGPTMAVMADQCPDCEFIVADINKDKIKAWQSNELPIYEPELYEVTSRARTENLHFTTDIKEAIEKASIIFVSVNTPTKTFGQGSGCASNLQYWEQTARDISKYANGDKIVVEKSTLPVKTAEAMHNILKHNSNGNNFEVLSNPEFMAEGTAVQDLLNPDRVLIGHAETPAGEAAAQELLDVYSRWVPTERILLTNIWSAELSKLTANAFLAQRISSINSISQLCEVTGANIDEVAEAIGMDSRIGNKFLKAGPGFGGSCFKKDILNLVYISKHYGLNEVARYWEQVVHMNDVQQAMVVKRVLDSMFNTVAGKKIAVFGYSFKADTGDTRESPAIYITRMLQNERADLHVYDPKAKLEHTAGASCKEEFIKQHDSPELCVRDAHAILVLTEWEEFKGYDYKHFYDIMSKPAFVFDARNILDYRELHDIGFNAYPLGKSTYTHFE